MSELAEMVRRRTGHPCEYCRLPQAAFYRSFHIEHIVARQHGRSKQLDNLALACWRCNLKKGPNLAGIDPGTGQATALFHPRKDDWTEHFSVRFGALMPLGIEIQGLTPVDVRQCRYSFLTTKCAKCSGTSSGSKGCTAPEVERLSELDARHQLHKPRRSGRCDQSESR